MSDATDVAAIDGQHVELLPARNLLSLLYVIDPGGGAPGTPGTPGVGIPGHDMLPIDVPVVGSSGSGGSGSPG